MLICQSFSLPVNPRVCSKISIESAMRLLPVLIVALCLLIFASIGSDAVRKTAFLFPIDEANKKKSSSNVSSSSSSSLEVVNNLFSKSSKNKNISLDEMRVVPTGPNPLHNR
ncbi:unnamed protein product [Dovyalis caffra]|uniref:Uncharacterized protein n=1 Tax=Dovyalis caffra TaxID=77055 RepID=A0AAV1S3J0_9ROSI|nr:unnamed protein product [Dovyalis caffra]